MIWPGLKPMLFSTPILRYPDTTAPLTTLATISTGITIQETEVDGSGDGKVFASGVLRQ
jgi:hypothetical protein